MQTCVQCNSQCSVQYCPMTWHQPSSESTEEMLKSWCPVLLPSLLSYVSTIALCCTVENCAVQCTMFLYHTVLYSVQCSCTVPYCAVQCTTVLYSVQLYWTVPYSAVLWKLYYTALYSTVKYRAEPRKLYSRTLCCTVESLQYKTVLHSCPVALWPIMLICLTIITVDHREPAWHS